MALWNDPPRTMKTALDRLGQLVQDRKFKANDISVERVQAVLENGRVEVRGQEVPVSGVNPNIRAGQLVHVVNQGGVPVLVLAHTARRAKFPSVPQILEGGVVEELFIANILKDVFFRNIDQVTALKLGGFLTKPTSTVQETVEWGASNDHFLVYIFENFATSIKVFKLNRTD